MPLPSTILADLPGSKPEQDHLAHLLPLLVGLPVAAHLPRPGPLRWQPHTATVSRRPG